ncbi:MAG TPA: site-specific DNA-methyltransferase [Candidatus Absconditabacterales bacterium]|nr:site-specific DNA-methyltransferase [Candidatus Absconditabacterales bacterium]
MINTIIHGDCLEVMKNIPDGSIDAIITDPPYGTTACKWDTVIPFEPMWEQLRRIIKPNGAIVLFASQPFTSFLIQSNITEFKYCWYWKKERGTGFASSGKRPLMIIEDIPVFYRKQPTYQAEGKKLDKSYMHVLPLRKGKFEGEQKLKNSISIIEGERVKKEFTHTTAHQMLEFSRDNGCRNSLHPTQKPVALIEYLIKTYTLEGEIVLDFTAGSFTTAVASDNTNRKWICIEQDEGYCKIGAKRINENRLKLGLDILDFTSILEK